MPSSPSPNLPAAAFALAPVALLVVDAGGRVVHANAQAATLLGYAPEALDGLPVERLIPAQVRARHAGYRTAFARAPAHRRMADGDNLEVVRADGTALAVDIALGPMEDGLVCVALSDATDHRRSERRLAALANTDPLTGLLNRRGFEAAMHERFGARRASDRFAFVLADVDRFKAINDGAGHLAGDALLAAIAEAMAERVRGDDLLARMGGDEFMVCLADAGADEAVQVAEQLRAAIAALRVPVPDGEGHVATTLSIGVAAYPGDGDDPLAVAAIADERLYAVKGRGRDAVGC